MSDTSQNKGLTEEISRREEDGAVFIVEDNVNITADEKKEEKRLETDETEDLNDDPEINGALPDAIDLVLNEIGEEASTVPAYLHLVRSQPALQGVSVFSFLYFMRTKAACHSCVSL